MKVLVDTLRPILQSKAFGDEFAAQGIVAGKLFTDAFGRKIVDDGKRFAEIVKRAGITPE